MVRCFVRIHTYGPCAFNAISIDTGRSPDVIIFDLIRAPNETRQSLNSPVLTAQDVARCHFSRRSSSLCTAGERSTGFLFLGRF